MAIANGMCVSFCNQPKTYYLATSWESRRYVVAFSRLPVEAFGYVKKVWVRPWDNCGKCCTDRKRIQCSSNAWQHILIYFQPFTSYSEILVGNCNFFLSPLAFNAPVGCSHWNSGKTFGPQKTRIMGLPGSEDSLTIGWAVVTQYQRVTDRRPIAIMCVGLLTHVKMWYRSITKQQQLAPDSED